MAVSEETLREALCAMVEWARISPSTQKELLEGLADAVAVRERQGRGEAEALAGALGEIRWTTLARMLPGESEPAPSVPVSTQLIALAAMVSYFFVCFFVAPTVVDAYAEGGFQNLPSLYKITMRLATSVGTLWPLTMLLLGVYGYILVMQWRAQRPAWTPLTIAVTLLGVGFAVLTALSGWAWTDPVRQIIQKLG
jgi:hypothetical protein